MRQFKLRKYHKSYYTTHRTTFAKKHLLQSKKH